MGSKMLSKEKTYKMDSGIGGIYRLKFLNIDDSGNYLFKIISSGFNWIINIDVNHLDKVSEYN